MAGIVYPKFWDELYLQDTGEWPKKNNRKRKKEMEEGMKILEEVFGKLKRPSLEEIKMEYDDMYKALNSVFSPRMFPSAFKRLEKWLKDEISKEY